jgi:hypothetical protein
MKLMRANPASAAIGQDALPGRSHHLGGSALTRWRNDIPLYESVRYEHVYPGVDLTYHGSQGRLRYEFVLEAGADPGVIRLSFDGARGTRFGNDGELTFDVGGTELRQLKPAVHQKIDGIRREVAGGYEIDGQNRVRFQVGPHDSSRPLVIDAILIYSTFLGGSASDLAFGLAVDDHG